MNLEKANELIGTPYDAENYHCWHFIEDVLDVPKLEDVHVDTANDDIIKYKDLFNEIPSPKDGCIVVMGKTHVGIWYQRMIYHNDKLGVRCEPKRVLRLKYNTFKFYEVKK